MYIIYDSATYQIEYYQAEQILMPSVETRYFIGLFSVKCIQCREINILLVIKKKPSSFIGISVCVNLKNGIHICYN